MRKLIGIFLLFMASVGFSHANCLPSNDALHECRYVEGDAWCAHHSNNPYAYSDKCLKKHVRRKSNHSVHIHIKQGLSYLKARKMLLRDGWQIVRMSIRPNGTPNCNFDNQDCKYLEIEACSGSGMGFCSMWFYDGVKKYLNVITAGDGPTDSAVHSWNIKNDPPDIQVD